MGQMRLTGQKKYRLEASDWLNVNEIKLGLIEMEKESLLKTIFQQAVSSCEKGCQCCLCEFQLSLTTLQTLYK